MQLYSHLVTEKGILVGGSPLTYKAPDGYILSVISKTKISQLSLHFGQINDDILRLDILMKHTISLALNCGVEDVSEKLTSFVFGQVITLADVLEQVRTLLRTLQDENEVVFVGEDIQQLNDIRVVNMALVESFGWELLTIDLQLETAGPRVLK